MIRRPPRSTLSSSSAASDVYKRQVHLTQIFLGFPSIILLVLYTKRPHAYNYGQLLGCSFFAMFIVQCRLFRSLPFVTLWPVVCMLAVTFGVPEYWDNHTYVEMLYWGIFLMPVLLLFFLEKQTRKSFRDKELATDSIAEIEHKTAVTQRMIANFFPKTPTTDLLHEIHLSLIHISEPTRLLSISYAVFCLKKKNQIPYSYA
eukprot:TRINITY_DN20953_c0_g1_i1.p1 TRINITY_DN20953_c0_g1~~TRINITY_DN20953_c0_g1_i1.p1  ORF type:complete len:202 (+),score=48.89 TRINITY_DN20953_c0_g1_i1:48-653(+)